MNYKKKSVVIAVALCLVFGSFMGAQAQEEQKRKPVVISGKSFLPLKVLVRPFSNIYKEADGKSSIVEENVPVFQSYFVYTKPETSISSTETTGWYEVGSDNRGTVLGWMKAGDVMEWKQAMCLAYEHPLGRKPVLMFKDVKPLRELVQLPSEERVKKAEEYYQEIETKQIPADFPIISMEPEGAIDITTQFYLLPILESAEIEIEGREGRLLKLASAPKSGRGKSTLTATETKPTEEATQETKPDETGAVEVAATPPETTGNETGSTVAENTSTATDSPVVTAAETPSLEGDNVSVSDLEGGIKLGKEAMQKIAVDIVYVVDMTSSMQPYIDATKEAIKGMIQKMTSNPEISEKVKFGLWGFRDSTEIPGMEFVTKNFTPQLQDVQSFAQTLANVGTTTSGSKGYDEDVFSGIDDAMSKTDWRENVLHIIVLVGDAPSHQPGHELNLSGQSAETLRIFADDNNLSIFAFHIINPKAQQYNELAEQQFRTLTKNPGVEEAAYTPVAADDLTTFTTDSGILADTLFLMMQQGTQGLIPRQPEPPQPGTPENNVEEQVRNLGYAALVKWIGSQEGVEAPRDITAWVTDKDLIDPAVSSLDVRVLINKKNLDSLKKVLSDIMAAGRRGLISGENFFDALLAVASAGGRDPDQIRNAKSLAATGMLPEFMTGLPYKSQVMEMNNETWSSLSMDQQEEFLNAIDAKLQLYVAIHDAPEGWVALTKGADADENVYPLSLEALP